MFPPPLPLHEKKQRVLLISIFFWLARQHRSFLHHPEDVDEKASVRYERQGAKYNHHNVVADPVCRCVIVVDVFPFVSLLRLLIGMRGAGNRSGMAVEALPTQ